MYVVQLLSSKPLLLADIESQDYRHFFRREPSRLGQANYQNIRHTPVSSTLGSGSVVVVVIKGKVGCTWQRPPERVGPGTRSKCKMRNS